LGQYDRCDRAKRQDVRIAFYSENGKLVEKAARIDHARVKGHEYEGGQPVLSGLRVLLPVPLRELPEVFGLTACKSW